MGEEASGSEPVRGTFMGAWDLWLYTSFIALLVTAVLYDKSARFRYYVKFAVYVVICSSAALIMIPPSLFRPRDVRNVL